MNKKKTHSITLSAVFLGLGLVLPLLTAQIKEIGDTLLPMHFPVLLCGFISGPCWGLGVGFVLPFLRSIIFSMPPMYPNAVWMALELGTYGLVSGWLYLRWQKIYPSLLTAMIAGRIVWGFTKTLLLGIGGKFFSFQAFIMGGMLDAIPGILIQLLLIPIIVRRIKDKRRLH